MDSWQDERWKVAGRSYDVVDHDVGEVLGEAVPEKILRVWLKQNAKKIWVLKEQDPSGRKPGTVTVKLKGSPSALPGSRYVRDDGAAHKSQRGKKLPRGKKDPSSTSLEDLKDDIMDRLPYSVMQKWWKKQDQKELDELEAEEENTRKRQDALESAFDWSGHAKQFVGDFKGRLKDGADPSWFVDDLAKAMKDFDSEGALKRMSNGQVASTLYDAVLKEMKRHRLPVI